MLGKCYYGLKQKEHLRQRNYECVFVLFLMLCSSSGNFSNFRVIQLQLKSPRYGREEAKPLTNELKSRVFNYLFTNYFNSTKTN